MSLVGAWSLFFMLRVCEPMDQEFSAHGIAHVTYSKKKEA